MSRYRLTKPQVRRLINGQTVKDGHGNVYQASKAMADALKAIDDRDAYGEWDICLDTRKGIVVCEKGLKNE